MGIILWLIIGGVVGWLASMVMRTDAQQGILLNIVVGIVGAFIGGLVFSGGSINDGVTLYSFLVSLVGAIILLAIINLVRRGSVRQRALPDHLPRRAALCEKRGPVSLTNMCVKAKGRYRRAAKKR